MRQNERKKWSREFKLEAVRRTQVTGKSVAEVARELRASGAPAIQMAIRKLTRNKRKLSLDPAMKPRTPS